MSAVTVFVVEDHAVVREGLRMLLDAAGDLRVVGAAATASAALQPLREARPDVVLLDLDLGEEEGLEWLPRIVEAAPAARVIILTAMREAGRDEAALVGGARGFVHKDAAAENLLRAIRAVAAGGLWFDPAMLAGARTGAAGGDPLAALTSRERDVVRLVGEGLRNEEIARRLGIGEKTVRNHLTAVFDKVGVSGRLELAVFAYRHGIARVRP
ncbi:MAG TPA: response regulator transcription factor [Anaeromyxobacter sp.]|nr:response regulator transcription factor [Anaeromyxobacter sp.]